MRFNAHAALVRYASVAVRTITRLMAAIATLGVFRRFYGMDGDEVGAMRRRHGLPLVRQAFLVILLNRTTLMAIQAE